MREAGIKFPPHIRGGMALYCCYPSKNANMKTLVFTTALSLLASLARSQDAPPADTPPAAPPAAEAAEKAPAKEPRPAWLGIGLNAEDGRIVIQSVVSDSPAAKAGLKAGDVIVKIDGKEIAGAVENVTKAVEVKKAGESIELQWQREDKTETVRIGLGERPNEPERLKFERRLQFTPGEFGGEFDRLKVAEDAGERKAGKDGDKLRDEVVKSLEKAQKAAEEAKSRSEAVIDKLRRELVEMEAKEAAGPAADASPRGAFLGVMLTPADGGRLRVAEVVPDSAAAKAGLKENDIIQSLDGKTYEDAQSFTAAIREKKPGDAVELRWKRGDREETAKVELTEPKKAAREERFEFRLDGDNKGGRDGQPGLRRGRVEGDLRSRVERDLRQRSPREGEGHFFRVPGGPGAWLFHRGPEQDAVWQQVEESVARSLRESGLAPEITERVMESLKKARHEKAEQRERRERLEREASDVERQMRELQERAGKLREELNEVSD